jgi:GWxTD domain-containing protein
VDLKNKRVLKIFFFIALLSTPAECYTQDSPAVSKGDLQFYIDHSSFSGKDGKTYTEFYLMLFSDQLMSNSYSTDTVKEFLVEFSISDSSDGRILTEKKWYTSALLPRDSIGPRSMVIYDQWAELTGPGTYHINVKVSIEDPNQTGEADFTTTLPAFEVDSFSISQIEFVTEVQNKTDDTPFIKGNRKIIPNPWRRYGALNSQLSFFYEIYNLSSGTNLLGEYIIRDDSGKIVKKLTDIKISNSSDNVSVVHGINISGLSTGVYNLNIVISDYTNDRKVSQSRSFEIIQLDSMIYKQALTEKEAEIEGALIEYVGTPKEYNLYENLDIGGKAQYIINFWSEKDPTPGTPENEFLKKIQERFHYSNENFKWGSTPGWKSDRGRVIIKYGMPDDTDQRSTEGGTKNYEVWTYNQDKTFIFVFIDLRSNGNYTLVHSTKEGEISDPNWMEYLR